ncbi:MAG: DUF58 domain-containing protein [Acidobacteria bacterium]|nr:DUF58 domain-containing protein [Acidobacteriota bacterium]
MTRTAPFLIRFLLLLLCLTGAAVNTGNNLLYLVLSLMTGFAILAFVATTRSLRHLRVSLVLPDQVAAGEAFLVGIEAASLDAWLPTGGSEVTLADFPGEAPAAIVAALAPGARAVVAIEARASKRGVHSAIGLRVSTTYPFGLFRRARRSAPADAIVVTPRRTRLRSIWIEAAPAAGADPARRLGDGAELFNIRDYTPQDDARQIDWKASARLDRTMMKELEADHERAIEIVLDERAAGPSAPAAFEGLVETAASILDYCAGKGLRGRLIVSLDGVPSRPLEGRDAMLYLATVQPRRDARAPLHGPGPAGAQRITLSLDPSIRTPLRLEPLAP